MSEKKQRYALTHPQRRIWYTEKLHPGTGMWNIAGTVKVRGKLDYTLLEKAINIFTRDNEAARLRIGVEDGEPYQYLTEYKPEKIEFKDFTEIGVKKLYEWDMQQTQAPMPLIDSCLHHYALMKVSENEGWLYAKFHHIVTDALSMVDYGNQVMANYEELLSGSDIPDRKMHSYLEYITEEQEYLSSKRFLSDREYWTGMFSRLPEPTVIKQKKTNYFSTAAKRKVYVIPARLSQQIHECCVSTGVSVFSLFLAALAVYVNRVTGKKDIIIGAPVANRTSLHSRGAFGMYVSTVPLRLEIKDDITFIEFANAVTGRWFAALKHQKYPYDLLMQDLRQEHKGLDTLYDVTLSYQTGKLQKDAKQVTYESRWHFNGYQSHSLSIHVNGREGDGRLIVDYDHQSPFFSEKEIEYFHSHITNILSDMIEHPQKPLYMLELMSDEERDRILNRFNNTESTFPAGETLLDMWNRQLKKANADVAAVVCGGQAMTYAELDSRSSALAVHLKKQGVTRDSIVGLLVTRSLDYSVGVLAILKAGGAFLPIDAELPQERISYMLSDSGAKALLISPSLENKCSDFNLTVVKTDISLPFLEDLSVRQECTPDSLAYVIYTSGSTGQPKGVQIEHHSAVHFVYSLNRAWDFSPGAKMLCAASFSFDMSIMEFMPALLFGATVVFAQEHEVNIPRNLVKLIIQAGVNMFMVTPGRMELLLSDKDGADCLQNIREISLGGDVLPEKLLASVQKLTRARIINFYGPTEITVCATSIDVTNTKVPNIGKPMPDVKAYILDEHKNPVPIGVPGELYIGGPGVSRGYLNKPELNAERFIDSPFIPGQKLYRTGDLTRWYPLGEIEFLGRIDKQVKIRGYRIELGEIEARLMQIPGVSACAVADRTDAAGYKFLCAYLCGNPPRKSEIKAQLMRDMPSYMIPSYFVVIDSLPFNASGKIDRDRLPDPTLAQETMKDDYVSPETATERVLAEIWESVPNIDRVGRYDSFFDVGGDSLTIVAVMAQVMQRFHVDIQLEEVYRNPRLKDFAALIDAAEQSSYRPIIKAPEAEDYPVSSAQQRMWILAQGKPDSIAYNIPIAFELHGNLDFLRLSRAFEKLIKRHDALRTIFVLKDGELRQKVLSSSAFKLEYIQCKKANVKPLLKSLIKPFDPTKAPLMRAAVIKNGEDSYVLFMDMHHIISDKRTAEVFLRDLNVFYEGLTPEAKEAEYVDYAVWQQDLLKSENISLQRDYWMNALSGELPLLNLHTDSQRTAVQKFEGARLSFKLPARTADRLLEFARHKGTTLFTTVLAAYSVLLSKYTGQEDIIIGTPVSGRSREEIKDTAGVFLNTLPLRCFPRGDMSFSEFFSVVQKDSVAALAHSDYPLERIIADLAIPRDASRNPLFDTMLIHARDIFDFSLEGMNSSFIPLDPKIAKVDLTLEVYELGAGLECQFEYNTRLFRRSTIKRMCAHLLRLFDLLMEEPNTRLCDVSVLTQSELWQVTQGFNQTDAPLDTEKTIQSIFEELAVSQGRKAALIVEGKTISFDALNRRANSIALRLREKGVGRNTIVALCILRSFDMMAGLLGVLKAGGGYLPLDPSYPSDRVAFMLSDSGAKILLTDGSADYHFNGETIYVQDIKDDGTGENISSVDTMEDAAYIIYTSGSTGVPKGAIIPRRALLNLYEGVKTTVDYNKDHVSVSITTVSFDIFIIDAFLPLLFGCTVALCTEEELRQPHLLASLIESVDAKFIQTTPTRMRLLMCDPQFRAAAAKHIEKIVLGGEEFPLSLLKMLKKFMKAKIISGYGPTETTVYCTFKDLSNTSHITIGRPIVNTRMYILDRHLRPVPIGVLGEAYISGACVATGYIHRDELNRKKYLPDPYWPGHVMYSSGDICAFTQNGEMEIRGRIDHQVKIRGMRIELGEIEAAMRKVKGVEEAVVKDWGEGHERYLCAYYSMSKDVAPETLREFLGIRLPSYMVPSYFVGMKDLPTTPNGKVNRKALTEPHRYAQNLQETKKTPMTDTEKKMAKAWSRVLKTEAIGPEDNFFALGGDSLGVIKVQAAVLQYGWNIRTKDFYENPTLRAICSRLGRKEEVKTKQENIMKIERVPQYSHLKKAKLKNILLTGATGYLGAHLLKKLSDMSGTHIYCVVRGKDEKACVRALREVLTFYFGAEDCARIMRKVTVLTGDIILKGMGLGETEWKTLKAVDTVIHSAAITDHVGHEEVFYNANVLGTENAIKAAQSLGASLLHVSTYSVSGTYYVNDPVQKGDYDESCFYVGQNYEENVYVKSKFLAEEAVFKAMADGLNARIMRAGMLTGTTEGTFQIRPERNAFANRLKALCSLGCVPAGATEAVVDLTPVDACAQAILTLAGLESDQPVYHVFNYNTMTLAEVVALLEESGQNIEVINDSEFMLRMKQMSRQGAFSELSWLIDDLGESNPSNITVKAETTRGLLENEGFEWPVIDAQYISLFLACIIRKQSKEG